VALIRRNTPAAPEPEPTPEVGTAAGRARKDRPTPSRKEAEAARRQRVTRTMTKKQARAEQARASRASRMRSMNVRESVPEKALIRDYIDARFSLGEFLLPSLVVILALTFLATVVPLVTTIATIVMYLFILLVILDALMMWRGFKRPHQGAADVRHEPVHPDPPLPPAGTPDQARRGLLARSGSSAASA